VLSSANLGAKISRKAGDFVAFEKVIHETPQLYKGKFYPYPILGMDWRLILRPLVSDEKKTCEAREFCKVDCPSCMLRVCMLGDP
jgi:hypothetical protein